MSSNRDRMVVGFTTTYIYMQTVPITTDVVIVSSESRSERGVQHYVIKFVSDWRKVGGFLQVLWFPPPIKLTATI